MPSYFRRLVREQMAASALERLRQIAMGELLIKRPMVVNKAVEIVECEPNEVTQRQALVDLLSIALPRQAAFVDDEGNSQTGVIILPALDEDNSANEVRKHEVVEEDLGEILDQQREDRDEATPHREETISPALVAQILAKRKNGGGVSNAPATSSDRRPA